MVEKASTCTGVPAEEEQGRTPSQYTVLRTQLPRIQSCSTWLAKAEFILEAGSRLTPVTKRRQTLDDWEISQPPNIAAVICRASISTGPRFVSGWLARRAKSIVVPFIIQQNHMRCSTCSMLRRLEQIFFSADVHRDCFPSLSLGLKGLWWMARLGAVT